MTGIFSCGTFYAYFAQQQQQCLEHYKKQKRDLIKYNNQMREGNVTSCTLHTEESPKFLLMAYRGISLIFIFVALSPSEYK